MENDEKDKNKRRLKHLENIVEKQTRTERHLEEHGHIPTDYKLEEVDEVQNSREDEINNLENIIAYGKHQNSNEIENIEKNIDYTQGYIDHNADHMSNENLKNAIEKQEHRKGQLKALKNNKKQ